MLRREADRSIPRVGTLSRNGPGVMRPWTRPSPYPRRLTSSFPRLYSTATRTTSTHHRSSPIRYAPYPRRSSSTSANTVTSSRPPRPQTLDFVGNFLKNVEDLQIRYLVSPTPPPSPSPIVSPALSTSTTPAPPNTPAIAVVKPVTRLNWETTAGSNLRQAAAEAATDVIEVTPSMNDLNHFTTNICPVHGTNNIYEDITSDEENEDN